MISGKKIKMKVKKSKKDKQVMSHVFVDIQVSFFFFFRNWFGITGTCTFCLFSLARQKSSGTIGVPELYSVMSQWTLLKVLSDQNSSKKQQLQITVHHNWGLFGERDYFTLHRHTVAALTQLEKKFFASHWNVSCALVLSYSNQQKTIWNELNCQNMDVSAKHVVNVGMPLWRTNYQQTVYQSLSNTDSSTNIFL